MNFAKDKLFFALNKFKKIDIFSFFIFYLAFIVIARIIEQLFGKSSYDWDIDHMMYFSGRLLKGELSFVREFDDKLPLLQYLFLIPAYFQNVKIWTFFSIFISCFTSYKIFFFTRYLAINDWEIKDIQFIKKASLFSALFFLFFISSLIGSFSHINGAAVSFSTLSLIFYTHIFQTNLSQKAKLANLIKSSFFSALAISIRPYLAPAIILVIVWNHIRNNNLINPNNSYFKDNINLLLIKRLFIFSFFLVFFGLTLNITPYLLTGNIQSFLNGIYLNSQALYPSNKILIIKDQLELLLIDIGNIESFIYLPYFIVFVLLTFQFLSQETNKLSKLIKTDLFFISILSPLSILLIIINKHFWPHYIQFYSGYSALSIFFLTIIFNKFYSPIFNFKLKKPINFCLVIVLIVFIGRFEFTKAIYKFGVIGRDHIMQTKYELVNKFVEQRDSSDKKSDFLYPQGIYVHWKLNESRYGFPHSAHFSRIEKGYWNQIKLGVKDKEDYSPVGFCKMLRDDAPTLIFAEKGSYEFKCLDSAEKDKRKKKELSNNLYVFIKD